MSISDWFTDNPFALQHLATSEMAHLEVRGHEDEVNNRIEELKEAIRTGDREIPQHTTIFGEWGHGKTHLLKKLYRVLADEENRPFCLPITVEPLEQGAKALLSSITRSLQIQVNSLEEVIEHLSRDWVGRHVFFLIDEVQVLTASGLDPSDVEEYFKLLQNLLHTARDRSINLNYVHCFSLNAAEQVRRLAALPLVREMATNLISLNSLSADAQFQLLLDRMKLRLKLEKSDTEVSRLLEKGVNSLINEVVGGNPRHALDLAAHVYRRSVALKLPRMSGSASYAALKDVPRHDNPNHPYIDEEALQRITRTLSQGTKVEGAVAAFLSAFPEKLLGTCTPLESTELAEFNLNVARATREMPALKFAVLQEDDDGSLFLSRSAREAIGLTSVGNIRNAQEKRLQFDLILRPETLLLTIRHGLEYVLRNENRFVEKTFSGRLDKFNGILVEWPGSQGTTIRALLAIHKGDELPEEFVRAIIPKLLEDTCDVIVMAAETEKPVSMDSGALSKVVGSLRNSADRQLVQSRVLIRNGSQANTRRFSEEFFVTFHTIGKLSDASETGNFRERYLPLLAELDIERLLDDLMKDALFVPDLDELEILRIIYNNRETSYQMSTLRESIPSVHRSQLDNLVAGEFLLFERRTWRAPSKLNDVPLFRAILREAGASTARSVDVLLRDLKRSRLVRGTERVRNGWSGILDILCHDNLLKESDDAKFAFVDIEKERSEAKRALRSAHKDVEGAIKMLLPLDSAEAVKSTQFVTSRLEVASSLRASPSDIREVVDELKERTEQLKEFRAQATQILVDRFNNLEKRATQAMDILNWPFAGLQDPFARARTRLSEALLQARVSCVDDPIAQTASETIERVNRLITATHSYVEAPADALASRNFDLARTRLLVACARGRQITGQVTFAEGVKP